MEGRHDVGDLHHVIPARPDVDFDDLWLLESFYDLNSERQITMGGLGPIPYSSIIKYVEFWEMDQLSTHVLFEVVRALDLVYTNHSNPDSKKGGK